ncbi:alpha/beta fold hydrolase [Leifsonia sp. TF02-11]|uniref:alpha/beta fold hydrolase n=1 Tax=Leifsonia sp. TF02-11 TaxID=2815212 RepID=UPI001AA18C76|nr:alpha/beta hydrolase [Leifsonia sp. TF02-11]MBO1741450.1 alpha/beta hydrolase [Leifsonia sp. TF02-11]
MKRITWAAAALAASVLVLGAALPASGASSAHPSRTDADSHTPKPTVVLVHGAWADAAGWTPVVQRLQADGYPVIAPPNPLRGLLSDAAYIRSVLDRISGPVVLVGHSYGGAVISNAATGDPNVKALVYIAAFAPDAGDSLASLNGSALGTQIPPVPVTPSSYPLPDGSSGTELTIDPAQYCNVFLDDQVSRSQCSALAVEQRPLSVTSATQASGVPAWKSIPSWYLVAAGDRAISPNLERFMAARAHARTTVVPGAPHLVMLTDPKAVTGLIETAARATAH